MSESDKESLLRCVKWHEYAAKANLRNAEKSQKDKSAVNDEDTKMFCEDLSTFYLKEQKDHREWAYLLRQILSKG